MKSRFTLLSIASLMLLASPSYAGEVESWRFDPVQNKLDITTDSAVQPQAFVINSPTRLVIDLPGTSLGADTIRKSYGSTVKEVRLGQVDDKTARLVVELAPGYTVSPDRVLVKGDSATHWTVNLSSIQREAGNIPVGNSEEKFPVAIGDNSSFAGGAVSLNRELSPLASQVKSLMSRYSNISPGMFFVDLETGNYLDINGEKVFAAASTIKFPVLVALFEEIDAGRIKPNEILVMRNSQKAEGSGELQYKPAGTKLSVLTTATKMITISDNTATNMIIDRLGGKEKLNERFRAWGLQNTVIRNKLGDFKGTNTTSAKDLVRLSALITNNQLISSASRSQALSIMRRVENKSLLVSGLGKGATIAHKTGTLGVLLGDAGIIEMPSGKKYLAGIIVRRPFGDSRGREFISRVSKMVYNYLEQPRVSQK
jgi:beta-lactamase class A